MFRLLGRSRLFLLHLCLLGFFFDLTRGDLRDLGRSLGLFYSLNFLILVLDLGQRLISSSLIPIRMQDNRFICSGLAIGFLCSLAIHIIRFRIWIFFTILLHLLHLLSLLHLLHQTMSLLRHIIRPQERQLLHREGYHYGLAVPIELRRGLVLNDRVVQFNLQIVQISHLEDQQLLLGVYASIGQFLQEGHLYGHHQMRGPCDVLDSSIHQVCEIDRIRVHNLVFGPADSFGALKRDLLLLLLLFVIKGSLDLRLFLGLHLSRDQLFVQTWALFTQFELLLLGRSGARHRGIRQSGFIHQDRARSPPLTLELLHHLVVLGGLLALLLESLGGRIDGRVTQELHELHRGGGNLEGIRMESTVKGETSLTLVVSVMARLAHRIRDIPIPPASLSL